jgi:hypothetical protein
MSDTRSTTSLVHPARMKLEPYSAEIRLGSLTLGADNIHYDVFLSPRFVEFTRKYLTALVRQSVNIPLPYGKVNQKKSNGPEHGAFRKLLTEMLQESLTRAKFQQTIEIDVLNRLAVLKFITQETSNQFASVLVECKDYIRGRGEHFEHSEQAHVMRSKISELQADRKNVIRQVGDTLYHTWSEVEENSLSRMRRALFGDDFRDTYELLQNRFLFMEGGNNDQFLLEHYVLLGNFMQDPDRFEVFDGLLLDFVREYALDEDNAEELARARKHHERLLEQGRMLRSELARVEEELEQASVRAGDGGDGFPRLFKIKADSGEGSRAEVDDLTRKFETLKKNLDDLAPAILAAKQRVEFLAEDVQNRLGDYLNQPLNARRLFDKSFTTEGSNGAPSGTNGDPDPLESRQRLLEEWVHRLEERDLVFHVLASYEMRKIAGVYCPPIHLQQLKKAIVYREETKRVEQILEQYPARGISIKKLEEASRAIRRRTQEETLATSLQFAEDLMRMRRDRRNYHQVTAWLDRINLIRSERSRELSRANKSLYELLHPDENRPTDDPVINHVVIKADVRGSTAMTKDLLARGMNPASHISMALHEPVKKILQQYSAVKVFIEGDAIILAIYETESTQTTQRAVARACILARDILAVTQAYNVRASAGDLPRLELGLGIAFQDSAPSVWMDGDSSIMISRALNLSDRLSSCSKIAKRIFKKNPAPFSLYHLQTLMEDADGDEGEELLVRYNLNGIELNEEGFQKLSSEISLAPMWGTFTMPWGKERVQLYFGEVPLAGSIAPIVIRKGFVHQLLPGGKIGSQGTRAYYEVCSNPKLLDVARKRSAGGGGANNEGNVSDGGAGTIGNLTT